MAVPPAASIISAVSLIVSGRWYGDGFPLMLRPVQYTVAPASPSARAMPRPAPRVAPATSATRPASGLADFFGLCFAIVVLFLPRSLLLDGLNEVQFVAIH